MRYEWTAKVLGRVPGQIEEIDESKEPRIAVWVKSGLVKSADGKHKRSPGRAVAPSTAEKE